MQVHACVSVYNRKGFRVGLVAGMQADQGTVCACVLLLFLVMHAHMREGPIGAETDTEICNPDYAAFH